MQKNQEGSNGRFPYSKNEVFGFQAFKILVLPKPGWPLSQTLSKALKILWGESSKLQRNLGWKVHLGKSRGTCIDFPNQTRSELEVLALLGKLFVQVILRGGQRNFGTPPKLRNNFSIASRWCKPRLVRGLENNLSLWLHRKSYVPGARSVSQRTIRRVLFVAHWGLWPRAHWPTTFLFELNLFWRHLKLSTMIDMGVWPWWFSLVQNPWHSWQRFLFSR